MQLKHKNGKEKHDLLIEAELEWLGDRKMFLRFQRKGLMIVILSFCLTLNSISLATFQVASMALINRIQH